MYYKQCIGAVLKRGRSKWNNISPITWHQLRDNLLRLPSLIPGFCLLPATLLFHHQLRFHNLPYENVWLQPFQFIPGENFALMK